MLKASSIVSKARGQLAALSVCAAFLSGCGGVPEYGQPGEMVMYGVTDRIRGFDPVKAGDVPSSLAIGKIYEGLYEYSYLDRPYRLVPLLAEGLPQVSPDGLTYTVKVRKGIFFSDDPCFAGGKGRELVAQDFVYSIMRVADLDNESSGYWAFNGRIAGLDEFREKTAGPEKTDYDSVIEGLRAVDSHTLQIRLKEPYPQLVWILAMHYAFAVPREAVEYYQPGGGREEFVNHPVGTGPFVLADLEHNYRIEFVRNPKWAETGRVEIYPATGSEEDREKGLLADAGKPIPFIDRIIQNVVDDDATAWLMFLTGQLSSSGISQENWDHVITEDRGLNKELESKGISLFAEPRMVIDYIGFNMDDPVVGYSQDPAVNERHRKLRQALTCAFNTAAWEKFNNYRVTRPNGPIPPGVAGYSDAPPRFPYDVARARQLLAEAGYPEGRDPKTGKRLEVTIELRSSSDAQVRQHCDLVGSFFDEIGVKLVPSFNNWPTFLDKMDRRQCQLYWLGWVADYPDAENFLQLFYGPNSSPGPNHSNYVNKEFDALYEQVRVMPDSPERTAMYSRMSDMVVEDCPWIFTSLPVSYALVHSWVANFKPHDFPYGITKYQKIDRDIRSVWMESHGRRR